MVTGRSAADRRPAFMLEVLLASYHRLRARQIRLDRQPSCDIRGRPTFQRCCHSNTKPARSSRRRPIPATLCRRRKRSCFTNIFLRSSRIFEEIERPRSPPRVARARACRWAVDRVQRGFGATRLWLQHLEEITLRIARCIVDVGGRIASVACSTQADSPETLLTLVRMLSADEDIPAMVYSARRAC